MVYIEVIILLGYILGNNLIVGNSAIKNLYSPSCEVFFVEFPH